MKYLTTLLLMFFISNSLVALESPKIVGIYVQESGGATPPVAETFNFSVIMVDYPENSLTKSSSGCGYIIDGTKGLCYINLAAFANEWSSGDWLSWILYVHGVPYGMTNQQITTGDGQSQYNLESDPYEFSPTPLPVNLSTFMALFSDGTPVLQWVTQSEINNAGWNVYRSELENMNESLQINPALIPGAGTTSETVAYSFSDEYDISLGTTYWYSLESVDFSGRSETYGPISLQVPEEGEGESPEVPPIYGLHNNYPNPFNPDTTIEFIPEYAGHVVVNIYNVKGQLVKNIFDGKISEIQVGDVFKYIWDGTDIKKRPTGTGIYFCKYKSQTKNQMIKMLLIK